MTWWWILLLVLVLLLIFSLIWNRGTVRKEFWFDVEQKDRVEQVTPKGKFTERTDFFTVYADPKETMPIGEYMIERTDLIRPDEIVQMGKGFFIFPEGTITFDISLKRKESGEDPSSIDAGYIFNYPIIVGTGAYRDLRGTVTFDVKSTLRRVEVNGWY